jgi:hypothetical protein
VGEELTLQFHVSFAANDVSIVVTTACLNTVREIFVVLAHQKCMSCEIRDVTSSRFGCPCGGAPNGNGTLSDDVLKETKSNSVG